MSVDISVLPAKAIAFSFRDVNELANKLMQSVLEAHDLMIHTEIVLSDPTIVKSRSQDIKEAQLDLPMTKTLAQNKTSIYYYRFSDDPTFWCIMYLCPASEGPGSIEENVQNMFEDMLISESGTIELGVIDECRNYLLDNGYYWDLSSYGEDHPLNPVAFICIASAIAALTHGIVASSDGGYDLPFLPATANSVIATIKKPEYSMILQQEKRKLRIDETVQHLFPTNE